MNKTKIRSTRERIRAAFRPQTPLYDDIDLLIQSATDERMNLWMFTAEPASERKLLENQRRYRIKMPRSTAGAFNEIDTISLEAGKALP